MHSPARRASWTEHSLAMLMWARRPLVKVVGALRALSIWPTARPFSAPIFVEGTSTQTGRWTADKMRWCICVLRRFHHGQKAGASWIASHFIDRKEHLHRVLKVVASGGDVGMYSSQGSACCIRA
mmetsp:Transcript_70236/g.178133  ORF Transcript_70236/g.178133 Transcript_70236/m.178133 type:complete len:125 (+) Transcript_70236:580-954(+)